MVDRNRRCMPHYEIEKIVLPSTLGNQFNVRVTFKDMQPPISVLMPVYVFSLYFIIFVICRVQQVGNNSQIDRGERLIR